MRHSNLKQNILRTLTAVLILALVFSSLPAAFASEFSGNCGTDIRWTLQGSLLRLTGTGPMPDYTETALPPWNAYADIILTVEVGEGITHVGNFSFMGLEKVVAANLPDSLQTIGSFAFYNCSAMETVDLGLGVREIGRNAFERCRSLKSVKLPGSLQVIRSSAFYRCESLLSVTVPASVVTMEQKVFTYCKGLRTATILANIGELPYWTFYGCYALQSVSLSSSITEVGASAFENCNSLTHASYGGSGADAESLRQQIQSDAPSLNNFQSQQNIITQENTTISSNVTEENGSKVTVEDTFFDGQDGIVQTQKVTDSTGVTVTVNAVLDSQSGWEDVDKQITTALTGVSNLQNVQVDVYLDPQGTVTGDDLSRFADRDIDLVIHTTQGAVWYIDCTEISVGDLQEQYDLSYTLKLLTDLTENQAKVIGSGTAYSLTFHGVIDFKVELELPMERPRNVASFLSQEESGSYKLMQKVVVDDRCMAHFYLGYVQSEVEYLIGINIPTVADNNSDVIVPNPSTGGYIPMEWVEQIDHIISKPESSWGIDIVQLTIIIVCSMVALAAVVGVVVKLQMKRKFKKGYTPDFGDEESGDE